MTHTQTGMGQALGVGALISSTFSIYFRRFPAIFLFGFAVYAVFGAISALVLGAGLGTTGVVPLVLDAALNLVAGSLLTSVIVLLAYDAKLGRPLRMAGYVGAALQVILVVLLLSLITSVIIFGAVAIIVGPAVALQSGFLSFVAFGRRRFRGALAGRPVQRHDPRRRDRACGARRAWPQHRPDARVSLADRGVVPDHVPHRDPGRDRPGGDHCRAAAARQHGPVGRVGGGDQHSWAS
jgi:hypothetical protein